MQSYGVYGATKLCFYDLQTGKLAMYFPSANSFGFSLTGESKEILEAGSPALTFQGGRKGTVKIDTQIISPKLLTIMLGAVETTEATGNFAQYETYKIDGTTSTVSIANAPATGTLSVFLMEEDGRTIKTELTVASGATPTASEYKISGQTINFDASNKNKPVLCTYAKAGSNITRLAIKSDVYAKAYKVQALGQVRQSSGVDALVEITVPQATAQSNMDLTFSAESPSSFSFTMDLGKDPISNDMIVQRFL